MSTGEYMKLVPVQYLSTNQTNIEHILASRIRFQTLEERRAFYTVPSLNEDITEQAYLNKVTEDLYDIAYTLETKRADPYRTEIATLITKDLFKKDLIKRHFILVLCAEFLSAASKLHDIYSLQKAAQENFQHIEAIYHEIFNQK